MLRLYLTFLEQELPEIPEKMLSAYRAKKLAEAKSQAVRQQSTCAELLLRYALRDCGYSAELPLDLVAGEYGKPHIKAEMCRFSLSHSESAVLCAVSDTECGADVQQIRPMNRALVERFYAAAEKEAVFSADDPEAAFTAIWTMKESYIKAVGLGLRMPLPSFSVLDPVISSHMWHQRLDSFFLAVYGEEISPEEVELIKVKQSALLL